MFFKKKREAKKLAAEEARQELLDGFEEKYKDALETRDPAAKILKLEDMKEAMELLEQTSKGTITSKAKGKWLTAYLGTAFGLQFAADAISIAFTGIPLGTAVVMLPTIVAGWWAGDKRVKSTREKLLKENEPFFTALHGMRDKADVVIESTLKTDVRDFAESPRFSELLARVPALRDTFAEAFKKQVNNAPNPPKKPDNSFKF